MNFNMHKHIKSLLHLICLFYKYRDIMKRSLGLGFNIVVAYHFLFVNKLEKDKVLYTAEWGDQRIITEFYFISPALFISI